MNAVELEKETGIIRPWTVGVKTKTMRYSYLGDYEKDGSLTPKLKEALKM